MRDVLDAFARLDSESAVHVARNDEEVDREYEGIVRQCITYMMEDPRQIGSNTHLIFMAKNLERIGDHATNIAKAVYYMVTGEAATGDPAEARRKFEGGAR